MTPDADLAKIVKALRENPSGEVVMACWDKEEAERLRSLLTPDDRERVQFTWLTFSQAT